MKATRQARVRHPPAARDGGQMLLLAAFILAAALTISVGTYTVLQRGETQVVKAQGEDMVDLFLNTRSRAIGYFGVVSPDDNNASIQRHLDGYLSGQHRTAQTLSMDLNASLAGSGTDVPKESWELFTCGDGNCTDGGDDDYDLVSHDGAEDYSDCTYDGANDGLIVDDDGKILAAILWIRVLAPQGELQEVIVIDVPDTTVVPSSC